MSKKMLIDATHAEETRVVVADGNRVEEFDFESENKRQLAGNIYLAKVTRVEPSLQAAFVDYGGNRHGFLAFTEIHPDYYQIPVADREALIAEEQAYAEAQAAAEEEGVKKKRSRGRSRSKAKEAKAEEVKTDDPAVTTEPEATPEPEAHDAEPPEAQDAAPEAATAPETETEPKEAPDAPESDSPASDAKAIPGMDVVEPEGDMDDEGGPEQDEEPFNAAEHAAEVDETIESVADEDLAEEIREVRKPRARRYKIQEVIKVRQILLVQVVKEERGNKGAALTTYLSLAGRYCVLMPNTARGGGISRKITNASDRKKLKDIAGEIDVPKGAGLIIRTAGAKRTKTEIKRDYEYLQRLWEQIREVTLQSIAPAQIYEEGNLIKRSIRDLYNRDIDEVLVEGETGYRVAKDFMKMIMPSHAKNVQHYDERMPLFARYQVESYLAGMFNPTVQLKSGGYIVIGVTEALVAIDVNSGKATKKGSIEETALETNLEAAEEIARQLRLRDLAGLIVIDFIDMEERKNNSAVEKRFKEKLKTDRARIQVGRISAFGLMEMSRQRLRPGMLEASTQPCPSCHGTGLLRSDDSLGLTILRQIEEEGVRRRNREVLVKAPVGIVNFLMNGKREHIAGIETRYGLSVRIEADPMLISPDFSIEKFKTATRHVEKSAPVLVSPDASIMEDLDAEEAVEAEEAPEVRDAEEAPQKKKRRRRRRRRSGGEGRDAQSEGQSETQGEAPSEKAPEDAQRHSGGDPAAEAADAPDDTGDETPKPKRSRRRSSKKKPAEAETAGAAPEAVTSDAAPDPEEASPAKPKRTRTRRKKAETVEEAPTPVADVATPEPVTASEPAPQPAPPAPSEPAPAPEPVTAEADDGAPKRRGWWSIGGR
ncbi:MAG: ribonuclease E/G [Pseudomonadota bacterium]